jgi:hypothetical protein
LRIFAMMPLKTAAKSDGPHGGTGNDVVLTDTRPPTAANDNYNAVENTTLNKDAAHGVLSNDTVFTSGDLTVYSVEGSTGNVNHTIYTAHGHMTLHADGSFTYIPDSDFVGVDDGHSMLQPTESSSPTKRQCSLWWPTPHYTELASRSPVWSERLRGRLRLLASPRCGWVCQRILG